MKNTHRYYLRWFIAAFFVGALVPALYLTMHQLSTLYNDYRLVSTAPGPIVIVHNTFIDFEGEAGAKPVSPAMVLAFASICCGLIGGFSGLAIAKIRHLIRRRLGKRQPPHKRNSAN